jgi:hypothetical protein
MRIDFKTLFYSIAGAIFLLGFAFYNGYPIVYSDTSTYIASGFSLIPPADRPLTYGLFIRLTSFNGLSLWSVAFIQSLIISFLIFLTIKNFTKLKKPHIWFLAVTALLCAFTLITFVSGQIITDIFLSIGILCIIHLGLNTQLAKYNATLLFIIFFLANAMHMSHLLINVVLLILIILVKRLFFRENIILNYKRIAILFLLAFLGIIPMGSSLSKSGNVFFMGRMAENGILQEFLKDNCPDKKYKLCDCMDSIPANSTDFLWDRKSPLYAKYERWSDANKEFGEIIRFTLLKPKYLLMHIRESAKNTFLQLSAFGAGDGTGPFVGETLLFERIKKYFESESVQYSNSKQNQGLLSADKLGFLNAFNKLIIFLSIISLLLIFFLRKLRMQISSGKKFTTIILFIAIFLNSLINSSLVIVTDRFGAKLIWMIPFMLLILISEINFRRTNLNNPAPKASKT